MAPRKRARTASSSSSSAAAAPKVTLSGGEAHHSSLVALWRKEKLTDTDGGIYSCWRLRRMEVTLVGASWDVVAGDQCVFERR